MIPHPRVNDWSWESFHEWLRTDPTVAILEPYAKGIWKAIARIQYDNSQEAEVRENKACVLQELNALQEFIRLLISYNEVRLNKGRWKVLGEDYNFEIIRHLEPILTDALDEFQELQKKAGDSKSEIYNDDLLVYVIKRLDGMPTSDELDKDNETGLISIASLHDTESAISRVVKKVKDISTESLAVRILTGKLMDLGVPRNNEHYRGIYELAKIFNYIPEETLKAHEKKLNGNAYSGHPREEYIKAFVRRITQ